MLDDLSLPVIVVVSSILTIVPIIVCIVSSMEGPRRTPAAHSTSGAAMGERDNALGFGETNCMWVRAIVVFVVASLAVVAVLVSWAVPDGVGGVDLFTEAAAVWKGEGSSRATSRHFFIVVLWHGEPSETVVTGVFYRCGYSYPTSAHFFRSVIVRNEGAVIKVWVNARDDPSLGEAAPSFGISNPPARPFISQLAFVTVTTTVSLT